MTISARLHRLGIGNKLTRIFHGQNSLKVNTYYAYIYTLTISVLYMKLLLLSSDLRVL